MNQITRLSLKNGAAIVLLCLLVLGYGFYSTTQIKQQTFPDVEFPALFIQAVQAGASTEEIESSLTAPIEDSLIHLKNYDSITSTSAENAASIVLQFPFGTDMDKRTNEIESALAKLKLPEQANVTVQRLSASAAPIYQAAVYAAGGESDELSRQLQDDIVPKMEKLSGVSTVTLHGLPAEELQIVVDKAKANANGITLQAIQNALSGLDYALPLGAVNEEGKTIPIRLSGKIGSVSKIEQLVLAPSIPQGAGELPPMPAFRTEPLKAIQALQVLPGAKERLRRRRAMPKGVEQPRVLPFSQSSWLILPLSARQPRSMRLPALTASQAMSLKLSKIRMQIQQRLPMRSKTCSLNSRRAAVWKSMSLWTRARILSIPYPRSLRKGCLALYFASSSSSCS